MVTRTSRNRGCGIQGSKHSGTVLYANLLNRADIFSSIHEVLNLVGPMQQLRTYNVSFTHSAFSDILLKANKIQRYPNNQVILKICYAKQ